MIMEPLAAPQLDINAICGTCSAFAEINDSRGRCGRSSASGRDGVIDADTRACRVYEIAMKGVGP